MLADATRPSGRPFPIPAFSDAHRRWCAACLLFAVTNAHGFAFVGDRRIADPGIVGAFIPAPLYWAVPVVPGPAGTPPIRTLNVTFNTAAGFSVAAADQPAVMRAVATWDNRAPILGADNLTSFPAGLPAGTPVKVLGGQTFDLETIFVHEMGHAIGLGHPDFADRAVGPAVPGPVTRFTASTLGANGRIDAAGRDGRVGNFDDNRGDDLSLHLVDRDNNPFNAFNGVIDKSTFTMDGPFATGGFAQTPTREVAAAGRAATSFNAIRDLEALMVQGARPLEVQRELTRDDLHGMSYLQSGPDQLSGGRFAADDHVFSLVFNAAGVASAAGAVPAGVQILVNNIALAPPLARTVFARPFASAIVEYDIDDETGQAIAQTDIWLDGPLESTGTTIQFVDVTLYDAFGPTVVQVPEPATMGLVAAGLMTLARRAWRRGRGNARR